MNAFLTILRDKNTKTAEFRRASDLIAQHLANITLEHIAETQITVETPVGTSAGVTAPQNIVLIPILRSGLALLPAFLKVMPRASVGMLGLERDEKTAIARTYYAKLPPILSAQAIILDPMLATGGSAKIAVKHLMDVGYTKENIYFTGVVAAKEGYIILAELIPPQNILIAAIDSELNGKKYIVPGLGDYGDRYFGT